jgi:hypothetical protein
MKAFGVMMFFLVFFILMLVTSAMPSIPPGKEVAGFLGIDLAAFPASGIPTATLLLGFFNGVVYGVAALLAFALATWMPAILNRKG